MAETDTPFIWPTLAYHDAPAAIRFLTEAFGFTEQLVVTDPEVPSVVVHSQLRWPAGGGVMLGSVRDRGDDVLWEIKAGVGACYVVTDEPDALFARATGAGAEVVQELRDEEYGSRGFGVRDPEGNVWFFGTYAGE